MKYTLYDINTGRITSSFQTDDINHVDLNLANSNYIDGIYSNEQYYINNGEPVLKPIDPSDSLHKYIFDYNEKSWILNVDQTKNLIRQARNRALMIIDRVNPVWYASLTADQQQELQQYRTQLLNVPQQSGFPTTIDWPNKPSWL